ncbi:MAG: (Fe-S)-binding protein [Pseudarcicella sp.]|nr:(Fe-S)-binding protein [Pseudarcicella sp.]
MATQLLFLALLSTFTFLIYQRVSIIKKTILLGKPENRSDQPALRWKTMLRIAFGQKKMFDRPIVGFLHFIIYAGFLLINIEVLEIILDGLLGTHRLFANNLGSFYFVLINIFEILAFSVLLVCVVFLFRRNITKVPRLQSNQHRELNGFPIIDAHTILFAEIILMLALFTMNATDSTLQLRGHEHYPVVGNFVVSSFFQPLFQNLSDSSLVILERITWWIHIAGILSFALYVSYSKHLHIFLAFPNTYFSNLKPKGEISNMPEVTKEVNIMLGITTETSSNTNGEALPRFGAKDIQDLSWKNLMDAYSCTECGRCTSACPANQTGKALSPRKIMMDTRDRLEEVGKNMTINKGKIVDDNKSLLKDYITTEELRACTTCNACVVECPINISPLDIILQLRRYQIMEESDAPASWNAMFANLENNQAPWKFSQNDRANWIKEI